MMILYAITLALAAAPFNVGATPEIRGLHRGGGHGKHGGRGGHGEGRGGHGRNGSRSGHGKGRHGKRGGDRLFLQDMSDITCPLVDCKDVAEDLDCNIATPERPDLTGMTFEERQANRIKMENSRKEHRQQVLRCACCTDVTIEDLIPSPEEEDSSALGLGHGDGHPGGYHKGHKGGRDFIQDMTETVCPMADCNSVAEDLNCNIEKPERQDFTELAEEDKEEAWISMNAAKKDHQQQILKCACCTNATIEDLIPPREEKDSFAKIDNMLDEHCPKLECPSVDNSDTVECAQLDSAATRLERRSNILKCVCCHDDGVEELQEQSEVEVSVLLASLLAEESVIQTKELRLDNPANRCASWSMLTLATAGAVFVFMF